MVTTKLPAGGATDKPQDGKIPGLTSTYGKATTREKDKLDFLAFYLFFLSAVEQPEIYENKPEAFDDAVEEIFSGVVNSAVESLNEEIKLSISSLKSVVVAPPPPKAEKPDPAALFSRVTSHIKQPSSLGSMRDDLLSTILKPESGNNYDIAFGGRIPIIQGKKLTQCTIDEVIAWQRKTPPPVYNGVTGTNAAGGPQFMPATLAGLKKNMNLTGQEIFSVDMQKHMAFELLREKGFDQFLSGEKSAAWMMKQASKIWAGLPMDVSGKSYYGGVGANPHKAGISPEKVLAALELTRASMESAPVTSSSGGGVAAELRTGLAGTFFDTSQLNVAQGSTLDVLGKTAQNHLPSKTETESKPTNRPS